MSAPLPHDLWLHVARFIPDRTLRGLLTVNASFFDIAMDVRYREVHFTAFGDELLFALVRLK